ncbi:hypothetical protein AB3X91_07575 [Paraburkholderia sp. BR14263]|uniref:hypothetical protein n=1 Tax=unclassified Paraburkholderia TaxID=2615204 RepID=UPI0034CD1B43
MTASTPSRRSLADTSAKEPVAIRMLNSGFSKAKTAACETLASGIPSPYTIRNLDAAIAHLERVLCADTLAIFGPGYWRRKIRQVEATSGLMHSQLRRLQALQERLPRVPPRTVDIRERTQHQSTRDSHRKGEWLG